MPKSTTKIDLRHATKKELVDVAKSIIRVRQLLKKSGKRLVIKKTTKTS